MSELTGPSGPTVLERAFDTALAELPMVAILRTPVTGEHLVAAGEVLAEQGVRAIEIPLTTPDALAGVSTLAARLGSQVVVGAGTVLDEDDARRAVDAGAELIVSPALCPRALAYGRDAGLPVVPGTFTPSEMLQALELGARVVKLFPADAVSPGYLRGIRAPLPSLRAIPTGGVSLDSAAEWLAAGAAGLGLGGPLVLDTLQTGDMSVLRDSTKRWVDTVRSARQGDA